LISLPPTQNKPAGSASDVTQDDFFYVLLSRK
jgi:hypothetical protein